MAARLRAVDVDRARSTVRPEPSSSQPLDSNGTWPTQRDYADAPARDCALDSCAQAEWRPERAHGHIRYICERCEFQRERFRRVGHPSSQFCGHGGCGESACRTRAVVARLLARWRICYVRVSASCVG